MDDQPKDAEGDTPWDLPGTADEAATDAEATGGAESTGVVRAPGDESAPNESASGAASEEVDSGAYIQASPSPEPAEAAAPNPLLAAPLPDSGQSMPPVEALLPPSPVYTPDDVFRSDTEDPSDFREGPAARPPRGRYTVAPLEPIRNKPSKWTTIALPFLAGIVGAGLVVGGFFLLRDDEPTAVAQPATAAPVTIRETVRTEFIGPEGASADPVAVARKVIPSVVTVQVGVSDGADGFNGIGSGSGVVLSADGYVVTNQHVVDGSDVVTVTFSDGRLYQAELLGEDALTDLAVLKIDAAGLIPIDIGSTADLSIGDVAIAAGSPLGLQGGPTVTVGVLSAFNREVQTGADFADRLLGMLQTDAPITRGSSGGALVDGQGALIGVTSAVGVSDVGVEGIGFAIPIEVVQRITDELIATGSVTHSFLGIEGRTSFEDQFDGAELAVGVFVQAVLDDSGASLSGVQEGDVIFSLEGTEVRTINSLVGQLRRYNVGEPLEVGIVRAGETITLTIELGIHPDDA